MKGNRPIVYEKNSIGICAGSVGFISILGLILLMKIIKDVHDILEIITMYYLLML